jgi:hypothetical protein
MLRPTRVPAPQLASNLILSIRRSLHGNYLHIAASGPNNGDGTVTVVDIQQ